MALKLLGFENRALRALTGHTSDQNLETYLRGTEHYPLAHAAQEALAVHFEPLLEAALGGQGNQRRFAGVTGRAATKAKAPKIGPEERDNSLPTANFVSANRP